MHQGRRTDGRRRRVLYTSHHADSSTSTAASRREAAKLREARRPPAAYGSKVHRRLRGRWFSLVPVKRRTLTICASVIFGITCLLCVAHYLSVTRPWLAYHPEIARPLRLDRPDSFGHWIMCVLLAASSGASLLIYQLRRYRNDDYRGQYRLWRLVLVLLMIASVHSLVGLVDWCGALLDAVLGKRVALTGNDWLRLFVGIGSAILAMRVIAEVRRSRWALSWVSVSCVFFAIPEAVNWNIMTVESIGRWTLVTSAPLIACTALFLSLVGYLRMLFREVRRIEDDSLRERFQEFKSRVLQRDRDEEEFEKEIEDDRSRRRWFGLRSGRAPAEEDYVEEDYEEEVEYEYEEEEYEHEEVAENGQADEEPDLSPRKKRRWFGMRSAKAETVDDQYEEPAEEPEEEVAETPKKKRRWSLRLNPANRQSSETDEDDVAEEPAAEESDAEEQPKRRFGLSWRRKPTEDTEEHAQDDAEPMSQESAAPAIDDEEDYIDPDEIDWDSLSKSERRRLRKKLKRQKRAA